MNTAESNKLIAEFMGYGTDPDFTMPDGSSYNNNMLYDTSWDWLITVVDRIESLGFQTCICLSDDSSYKFKVTKSEDGYDVKGLPTWDETRIKATYRGVVEFIKWYNENK